jgi:hypothetical protein
MAKRQLPTPEELRQLLRYEPETGKLFWRERGREWFASDRSYNSWNARDAGTEAFTSSSAKGYKNGAVLGRPILAHRAAWAIHYGEWPIMDIDHTNCNPADNRIINLRLETKSDNHANKPIRPDSSTGMKGVSLNRKTGKWIARIMKNKKREHLGCFDSPAAAKAAYNAAAVSLHGEFCNFG